MNTAGYMPLTVATLPRTRRRDNRSNYTTQEAPMKHNPLLAAANIFLWKMAWQTARKGVTSRRIS